MPPDVQSSPDTGPTPKQVAFINKLLAERAMPEFNPAVVFSRAAASEVIELLLATPKPATTTVDVPEGLHLHGGQVYKVQRSKSDQLYAKQLVSGSFDYVGKAPLRNLSENTVLTIDAAKEYGIQTGVCCCCGRTLTDPNSIAVGIGPICANKF